jgi:DNA-binding transcriptional MerR regulator
LNCGPANQIQAIYKILQDPTSLNYILLQPVEYNVMNNSEQLYTIQQLSVKLNIPKPTLRFWEKELNGIIIPFRTQGGQRRYSVENLKVIEEVNELRKSGMSIAEIRGALKNHSEPKDRGTISTDIDDLAEKIAVIIKKEVRQYLSLEAGSDNL